MKLVCPACRVPPAAWEVHAETLACSNAACRRVYPRIGGVPALLREELDAVREHDSWGALDEGLDERIAALTPGTEESERVLRSAMYLRSHYVDAPSFIEVLGERLLSRLDRPIATAVDLGCGVGGMALEVAHRFGADVVGLDADPLALRWASLAAKGPFRAPLRRSARHLEMVTIEPPGPPPRGSVTWLCANAAEPPLPAESCDLVLLVNVLDSVPHPSAVLAQAAALLAPGGHLLLAQPDAWSASSASPEQWLAEDDEGWDEVLGYLDLRTVHRTDGIAWVLQRTERCSFHYRLHARLAVRDP